MPEIIPIFEYRSIKKELQKHSIKITVYIKRFEGEKGRF
jgi:hypothetical protein